MGPRENPARRTRSVSPPKSRHSIATASRAYRAWGGAERLDEVWTLAAAQLSRRWTAETLSAHTGYSTGHFRRLCLGRDGETPMRRLSRMRLEHPEGLLAGSEVKIGEVAERPGYGNAFSFSEAFARHSGLQPAEWRGRRKVTGR